MCSFKFLYHKKDEITKFWDWFSKNSKKIYSFEENQNVIFANIKKELNKIDPNLVFEFSQKLNNKKREFVISAGGIISSFPSVKKIVDQAPELNNWVIVAFKQPNSSINELSIGSVKVDFNFVYFKCERNVSKIDLVLYFKNFTESPEWTPLCFLMLDVILGEYDTELYINSVERKPLNEEDNKNLHSIRSLPKILNQLKLEVNN